MKKLLSSLACLLCATAVWAQQTVIFHDWTVKLPGNSALFSLRHKQRTVIDYASLSAFKPQYKGMKFALKGKPAVAPDASRITWKNSSPHGEASLVMTLTPTQVTLDYAASVREPGPLELGIGFHPQNFKNDEGTIFYTTGKDLRDMTDATVPQAHQDKVTFVLPHVEYTFAKLAPEPLNMLFQDRRKQPAGDARYITAIRCTAKQQVNARLAFTAKTFSPRQTRLRQLAQSAPTVRYRQLSFPNPGFETGRASWNFPANAALDKTVKHAGTTAARLTVKDPMKEDVYITRKIPVTPGAWYTGSVFLKTKDITPAQGKKHSSVGAGIIIEWSDKNGKWIDAGIYACNNFGTHDWQKIVAKEVRAPMDAGYAEIFLTLRGKGTAWFDQLTLTEMNTSVKKTTPLTGDILTTNVPLLTWSPLKGISNYTVLLAPTPDFIPADTITYQVPEGTRLQLEKPLPPGTWYWKVNALGSQDVQTWSFSHDIPITRDCLPPIVNFQAKRILNAKDAITIPVIDQKGQMPAVTVKVNQQTFRPKQMRKTDANSPKGTVFEATFQPTTGWPKGFSTITIMATDPAGNTSTTEAWLLNAPPPPNPVVIDGNGRYASHGKPFFPLGIYEVSQKDMLEVRNIGFDCVHTYRWEGNRDNVGCRQYLDDCWNANKLRAFIGFRRADICNGNFKVIAERVGAIADHPGLFCWYLFDEPEIPAQYVPPKLLTQFADLIRTLDPYHAVVMTTWGRGMNRYRRTWDTHWTQAYYTPDKVIGGLDEHRRLLLNQSPITLLIHCYDKSQTQTYRMTGKYDAVNFKPDYDWLRCAALAGVTQNVNGLWWWWFARGNKSFITHASIPKQWANVIKVIKELKSYQKFLDAVPTPNNNGRLKVGDNLIVWCVKETADQKLVIIANTGEKPVTVNLKINGQLPDFNLNLKRYGVHTQIFPK